MWISFLSQWVAEASSSHSSTPVKIESALQFVPKGTNPKEFKQKQQQVSTIAIEVFTNVNVLLFSKLNDPLTLPYTSGRWIRLWGPTDEPPFTFVIFFFTWPVLCDTLSKPCLYDHKSLLHPCQEIWKYNKS